MILSVKHLFLSKGIFSHRVIVSIRFLAFSLTEMFSFHPVESGSYSNFGYGNSRRYCAVNSGCNHIYGIVNSKVNMLKMTSLVCCLSLTANQTSFP